MPGTRNHRTRRKSSKTQSLLLHMCRIAQAFFHPCLPKSTLHLETGGGLYRTRGQEVTFHLCMKNHVELKRGRDLDISLVSVRSMFCPGCRLLHCATGPRSSDQPGGGFTDSIMQNYCCSPSIGLLLNELCSKVGQKRHSWFRVLGRQSHLVPFSVRWVNRN